MAKVLELQLQHQSISEYSGLIAFRMDGLDCLAVQETLQESSPTPQLKSINSSYSAFFIVQLSHPYMITGKTIALTRLTFVGKVMSLLFNMLSRKNRKYLFLYVSPGKEEIISKIP